MDVTVLIPTRDEELVVEQFIEWCKEGFANAGVTGEIVFADNSQDKTPEIARRYGAVVVDVKEPGVGRAYREAGKSINGEIVILGDVDCTYDFRDIKPFLFEISRGADFVIGSRLRGKIQKGAMPKLHQYFGTPLTTLIFDLVHGVKYTDIHCGMRAMTRDAFDRLLPQEPGWQYASEMLARARHLKILCKEVPINFYIAPNERESHLKRGGWRVPIREGIGTLVTTLKYASDRVFKGVGIISLITGIPLLILSMFDSSQVGIVQFSYGAQLLGLGLSCIGTSAISFSVISRYIYGAKLKKVDSHVKASELRRNFLGFVAVFTGSLYFAGLYIYRYFSGYGNSLQDFSNLSRLIGPIIFMNYYFCIKIVTTSLQLFILEKQQ